MGDIIMGQRKRAPKYVVELSDKEYEQLRAIITSGTHTAREIKHAHILIAADAKRSGHIGRGDIAERYHCDRQTVLTTCQRYVESGLESAIFRKKREIPPVPAKITGEIEAKIIALSCSQPPKGYSQWSLRLLANQAVELQIIDSISHDSVARILKKKSAQASPEKAMGDSPKRK